MGATLKNKERYDAIKQMVEYARGNTYFKVDVRHRTVNKMQYQRIYLLDLNIPSDSIDTFFRQVRKRFMSDLVKITGDPNTKLVLYFKYLA